MTSSLPSHASGSDDAAPVPRSIGRALDLLEAVLSAGDCSLTRAAGRTDLTPTTALRYLRALETRGYVARDDAGLYSAGPTLGRLAASLRETGPIDRLMNAAQPYLDRLASETGESCYLAVGDRNAATYVAAAEGTYAIRHVGWIGQTVPLEGTAVGAALAKPGRVTVRTGAVEPGITALSFGLERYEGLDAAISVIGPQARLGKQARGAVSSTLERFAESLRRDLLLSEADS